MKKKERFFNNGIAETSQGNEKPVEEIRVLNKFISKSVPHSQVSFIENPLFLSTSAILYFSYVSFCYTLCFHKHFRHFEFKSYKAILDNN